ncbi:MAG TPA: redox-regulated ATPase YchF [Firmicutes bacterium]|nr:redox-regulated ATPase YchF [Bacillota bacterium]
MQAGLVGLPNAGKSTLFNALTRGGALVANYPFSTIDPNVGVAELADKRLEAIVSVVKPQQVVPAVVHFVDIAGLVRGANKGEGLGNQFLSHIRAVDALVHVVRCFHDEHVAHVTGAISPRQDIEVVETELMLADLQAVEKRMERVSRDLKTGLQIYKDEMAALEKIAGDLQRNIPARLSLASAAGWLDNISLLTAKPVVYCANVGDDDPAGESPAVREVIDYAKSQGAGWVVINAKLEAELAELPAEEAAEFLAELQMEETGLSRLAAATYRQLGLITFYTVKGPQTRAWSLPEGTPAPRAAGMIHSDMERGFIRAEVIQWDELVNIGSFQKARDLGKVRSEGKDYIIQDGDVVLFRFNV